MLLEIKQNGLAFASPKSWWRCGALPPRSNQFVPKYSQGSSLLFSHGRLWKRPTRSVTSSIVFRLISSEQKPLSLFRFIYNPQSLLTRYCFMSLVLRSESKVCLAVYFSHPFFRGQGYIRALKLGSSTRCRAYSSPYTVIIPQCFSFVL